MKVFLSIGNSSLEEVVRTGPFEVVDAEDNLNSLYDLLEFVEVDGLVINRLLGDSNILEKVTTRAVKKGIKVVILIKDFKDYEERKVITGLVNVGVTGFIELDKVTGEEIGKVLLDYPEKFDFGVFADTKVEYRDVVKTVFKQVFTVYSPASQGATTIAAHLAAALAKESNSSVCLLDYNPFKPWIAKIIDTKAEFGLQQAMDAATKNTLTNELLQGIAKQSKQIKKLNFISGIMDLNDYYISTLEQYEEIIKKLQFTFDYVVIDTHSYFDMLPTDAALRLADKVLVPVRAEKYSIDHLNRMLKMFKQYDDYDVKKFNVIFNAFSETDLTFVEAQSNTELPCAGFVSRSKEYYIHSNVFGNSKLMKEYSKILENLDVKIVNQGSTLKRFIVRR